MMGSRLIRRVTPRPIKAADTEDENFWREPGQFGARNPDTTATASEVDADDRVAAFTPIGVLDAHGVALVRYVIPIKRPIGFGRIHDTDDGAVELHYITTEAAIRVSHTQAGNIEEEDSYDDDSE